jgi:hypothetical protein
MKPKALICAGLIGLACAISASAEETTSGGARSVIGFLDPQTGALLPLMATTSSPEIAAASSTVTGTLKITGTVTLITSIPSTTPVTCGVTAIVASDPNGPISEQATSTAARSGATATCTVLIPYEWILQSLTDNVSLSVSVAASSFTTTGGLTRVHTRQLATFKVPANGVTTSFTFVGHL